MELSERFSPEEEELYAVALEAAIKIRIGLLVQHELTSSSDNPLPTEYINNSFRIMNRALAEASKYGFPVDPSLNRLVQATEFSFFSPESL